MLTFHRVTQLTAPALEHLGPRLLTQNLLTQNPSLDLRPFRPAAGSLRPAQCPIRCALQDAWCPWQGPLLTVQDRARPGRGEGPLGSWQLKVCADPEKPPRPREKRRESPRPAPPPATGSVTSAAQ